MSENLFRVWVGTAGWIAEDAENIPRNDAGRFVGFWREATAAGAIRLAQHWFDDDGNPLTKGKEEKCAAIKSGTLILER